MASFRRESGTVSPFLLNSWNNAITGDSTDQIVAHKKGQRHNFDSINMRSKNPSKPATNHSVYKASEYCCTRAYQEMLQLAAKAKVEFSALNHFPCCHGHTAIEWFKIRQKCLSEWFFRSMLQNTYKSAWLIWSCPKNCLFVRKSQGILIITHLESFRCMAFASHPKLLATDGSARIEWNKI